MPASPASSIAQRLEGERPVDAVDDEPRRVATTTGVLPQRSISAAARATELASVCGPRTTSTSGISGAGLKKWSPSTCSGRLVAAAIAATDSALVFVARIASGGASRSSAPKIVRLRSRSSRAASIDDVGRRGDRVQRHRRAQVRKATLDPVVDRIRVELELRRAPAEAGADPLDPSFERLLVDVVEHDLVARLERDLGDPRAHRPRADDTDDGAGEVVGPVRLVHDLTVRQRPSARTSLSSTCFEGKRRERAIRST